MTEIEIIRPVGSGETEVVRRFIPTTEFVVKIGGEKYSPAITSDVEIENSGDVSKTKDQCGNTERSRQGNNGWSIRVQGIITDNDDRDGNLSLALMRDVVAVSDTVKIRTDVIRGEFEVGNTVITQSSDLVSIETKETAGPEKAFDFQLQLGQTSAES